MAPSPLAWSCRTPLMLSMPQPSTLWPVGASQGGVSLIKAALKLYTLLDRRRRAQPAPLDHGVGKERPPQGRSDYATPAILAPSRSDRILATKRSPATPDARKANAWAANKRAADSSDAARTGWRAVATMASRRSARARMSAL